MDAPPGTYGSLSMSEIHVCALEESGDLACWGGNSSGQTDVPHGRYQAVSVGRFHTCALRDSGEVACWGAEDDLQHPDETDHGMPVDYGQAVTPDGKYLSVAAGEEHTCAVRESGELLCWGRDYRSGGSSSELRAPPGAYRSVATYRYLTCALRESGELVCWIPAYADLVEGPPGKYRSLNPDEPCAVHESGKLVCWSAPGSLYPGDVFSPATYTPSLAEGYRSVSWDGHVTFAVLETGEIVHWGGWESVPAELR